jgi:predicted small lipoprotein YifL
MEIKMLNHTRKLFTILLAVMLLLSLAGCGPNQPTESDGSSTPKQTDSAQSAEKRGNTVGNNANFAFAAIGSGNGLYVLNQDIGLQVLSDGTTKVPLFNINWYDGWLYGVDDNASIVRFSKSDGSDYEILLEKKNADEANTYLSIVDGWIYFVDDDDSDRYDCAIYKMRTDGTGLEKLNLNMDSGDVVDEYYLSFCVTDGWIYWCAESQSTNNNVSHGKIYRMKIDGSDTEKFIPKQTVYIGENAQAFLNVVDGWMYYIAFEEDAIEERFGIYKTRVDGTETQALVMEKAEDGELCGLNVSGEYVYYLIKAGSREIEEGVYTSLAEIRRVKTDGLDSQTIICQLGDYADVLCILDNAIFYMDFSEGSLSLCKVNTDGSNPQVIK